MANSKKKRDEAKRRSKRKLQMRKRQDESSTLSSAQFVRPDIHREIRYITQLAQAGDSRIVSLNSLVLFSTQTGDAWLLDAEDDFALCLCRAGEPQPFRIIDTPKTFGIDWPAQFAIEGDMFIVGEKQEEL